MSTHTMTEYKQDLITRAQVQLEELSGKATQLRNWLGTDAGTMSPDQIEEVLLFEVETLELEVRSLRTKIESLWRSANLEAFPFRTPAA